MSTFFTTPASQRKRKRTLREDGSNDRRKKPASSRPPTTKPRTPRNNAASGSEQDDDDENESDDNEGHDYSRTLDRESSSSESEDNDPAGQRTRLAERYLENTRQQVLAEGFDAEDIDKELLAERMGERLNEDTAESKGKLYRWIADSYRVSSARHVRFRTDANVLTSVAVCYPYIYTVAKDSSLTKWEVSDAETTLTTNGSNDTAHRIPKPRKLLMTRGRRTQDARGSIERHTGPILCVAASEDGKFIATGGQDHTIIVWDALTLQPLRVFSQHRDSVVSLCFRKGTNQMFSASKDRTIKIWSLNELSYIESLFGHQDSILDISALHQETCVSVGAMDRTARFWRVVEETQLVFRGGGVPGQSAKKGAMSNWASHEPDEKRFAEGSLERVVMIDDETFVTGSDSGNISLWNIQKKKAVFTFRTAHGLQPKMSPEEASAETQPDPSCVADQQPRWITALVAVPFSNLVLSGSWDGYVRAWAITTDKRRLEPLGPLVPSSLGDGAACGVVNDLAIFERGERGRDGLYVVAAVGKEHRLGRWIKIPGARNTAVMYHIPRDLEK